MTRAGRALVGITSRELQAQECSKKQTVFCYRMVVAF